MNLPVPNNVTKFILKNFFIAYTYSAFIQKIRAISSRKDFEKNSKILDLMNA